MKRIIITLGFLSVAACGSDLDVNVHGSPSDSNGTATSEQQPSGNPCNTGNGNQQVVDPNSPKSSDGNFQVVDPNTGVVQQGNTTDPNAGNSNTVANANDSNVVNDPNVDCQSPTGADLHFNWAAPGPNPNETFVDAVGLYDYRYGHFTVGPTTQPNDPNQECYRTLKAGVMSALSYGTCHSTWSMSGYPATYDNGTVTFSGFNGLLTVLNDDGTGTITLADGMVCDLKIMP